MAFWQRLFQQVSQSHFYLSRSSGPTAGQASPVARAAKPAPIALHETCRGLAFQNFEGLLQPSDLGLPAATPLLVRFRLRDAAVLELGEVLEDGGEFGLFGLLVGSQVRDG